MGKLVLKFGALALIVVLGYPVIHYRAVTPCGMYRKELTWHMERQMQQAAEIARDQAAQAGADGERAAAEVQAALEGVAAGVTAGVVEAKVRRMSTGECVGELWRVKVLGREP